MFRYKQRYPQSKAARQINLFSAGVALSVVLFAGACSPVFRSHGYVPTSDEISELAPGQDTRGSVQEKLGYPAVVGVLEDDIWYYVQSRWEHFGMRAPREINREVVALSFDQSGILQETGRFGLEKGQVVVLSRRQTKANTIDQSFLKRVFSNTTLFNPGQLLGGGPSGGGGALNR